MERQLIRIDAGPIRINATERRALVLVRKKDEDEYQYVSLTSSEYALLEMLAGRIGTYVSNHDIYNALVRGSAHKRSRLSYVRKKFRRVRSKLTELNPRAGKHLRSRSLDGQTWGRALLPHS